MAEWVECAFLGAVVSATLTTVIDLSKKTWRCSNDCDKLARTVDSARPYVEALKDSESTSCEEWLQQLKDLLDEAKDIMEKYCVRDSIHLMVFRVFYLKKSKLSLKILDINERIKSKVGEVGEGQFMYVHRTATMILQEIIKTEDDKSCDVGSSICYNCYIPHVLPRSIVSFANDPFQELKSLIISECDLEHPPISLGLIGCGGVGKTLVAKMLHNDDDVKEKYGKESVLWVTVGRDANLSQVYEKMGKFLSLMIGDKDLDDQFTSLVKAFQKGRVLLILDDVWDANIGGKPLMEWLNVAKAKGSVTLVTTRSGDVLRSARAKQSISIPLLSPEKSWELFSSHAFGDDVIIPLEIKEIATQVCKNCGDLPLALEVIGASMYGERDVLRWKHALARLTNLQGKDTVLEQLKYSYEEVGEEEQKLFLYFAAFPEDYEIPTKMLCSIWHAEQSKMIHGGVESVYLEGMEKLFTLADRSLIKLSEDAEMATIHDILRELAMDIIKKTSSGEYYFHPGKVLVGLPLPIPKNMKRMSLMGSLLCDSLDDFNQVDLEVLLLSGLHEQNTKGGGSEVDITSKILSENSKLRYIDLSHTRSRSLCKEIEKLSALMYLDLSWCESLKNLPENIVELKVLISLNLSQCQVLEKLPKGMGKMKALTFLDLSGCESLHNLPDDIVELESLTSLNLSGCGALEKLPEGMAKLKALISLDLSRCESLQNLPVDIVELEALISLNLSRCGALEKLPEGMAKLKALISLDLSRCESLQNLPEDIVELEALISLNLSGCGALEKLPEGMAKLKALTSLDLSRCESLQNLPEDIVELKALISLNLSGCGALERLPQGMAKLKALTSLDLSRCESLQNLPEDIVELQAFISLNLSGCGALEKLPEGMAKLKALTSLDLSRCESLQNLPEDIMELKALISLNLSGCGALERLPQGMEKMKALTSLDLSGCISLNKLPLGIKELKALTLLDVSGCTSLGYLPESIKELKAPTSFDLSSCVLLKELPEGIKKLQADSLTCERCSSSRMMELKEKSSESFEMEEREAQRIFEIDESIDVDPSRLHHVGTPMNDSEIKELEALPFLNSSDEIHDEHGEGDKLEAELIKVHAIDMVDVDIPVDLKKTTFEEIMEGLIALVKGAEAQMTKFLQLYSGEDIQVFKQECSFLVTTLSHIVRSDRLRYYSDMLRVVQETGVNDRCRIMIYVTFCIVALTELERMFQAVVELLTICSDEKWWNTALELSNVLPSSSIPRLSRFSLAIRSCEWSMDIVDLAFHALQHFLAGASTLHGVVFKWSDKQLRMVLHIDGKPLYHNEGEGSLLDVTRELEGKDVTALIDKFETLKIVKEHTPKQFPKNRWWKRSSNVDANLLPIADMPPIADFLRKKLCGPIPEPSSLPDTFELDPSTLIHKSFIGSGGNATVWKYEWLGQTVGVKTIYEVSRKQLKAEAAILASVQHPNVVRIIGCAFEEKDEAKNEDEAEIEDESEIEDDSAENEDIATTGHLVMELMEGDLSKVINKRCRKPGPGKSPFPLIVAIDIMLQIGEGMQYLREHKILHRDLKAKNVLINRCSTSKCGVFKKFPNMASVLRTTKYQRNCYYIAKLADFGIAKARCNETSFKTPNLGTGSWRAPEVLNVTADKYEWPADVYSFAMTCYEILTGRVPFDKVLPTKLHQHIEAGHRPPLDDVVMPQLLRDLLTRCWETDPKKRPNFDEICKTLWQCKVEIILPGFRLQIGP